MNDIYKTSDTAFAAYLMLHGYTHLGCVDNGEVSKSGQPRIDHYLTHYDDSIRVNLPTAVSELMTEFFKPDPTGHFKYSVQLHAARKKTHNPIDPSLLGKEGV